MQKETKQTKVKFIDDLVKDFGMETLDAMRDSLDRSTCNLLERRLAILEDERIEGLRDLRETLPRRIARHFDNVKKRRGVAEQYAVLSAHLAGLAVLKETIAEQLVAAKQELRRQEYLVSLQREVALEAIVKDMNDRVVAMREETKLLKRHVRLIGNERGHLINVRSTIRREQGVGDGAVAKEWEAGLLEKATTSNS